MVTCSRMQQPTLSDIFDAIKGLDRRFVSIEEKLEVHDRKFEVIESKLDAMDSKFDGVDSKFSALESKIDDVIEITNSSFQNVEARLARLEENCAAIPGMRADISRIESRMVTKDYLDKKMADMRGDLVDLAHKEDCRVDALIDTLHSRKGIGDGDRKMLADLSPFPRA